MVDELLQNVSSNVKQIIRVYKEPTDSYIEFDWLVGDLDMYFNHSARIILFISFDFSGTELITSFTSSDITNNGLFFTETNGRQKLLRTLNKRSDYEYNFTEEPVSSNYYPINHKIVIEDQNLKVQLAVINDRPQAGSSLKNGSIEFLIHRRLSKDDDFGVGEALNEVEYNKGLYVRGQHYLTFGSIGSKSTNYEKSLALSKLHLPWILLADATTAELNSFDKVKNNFNLQVS